MLPFQGVSVELQSNGKTLPLYDDPDHDSHQSPRKRQQYIEAITGAAFKVVVTFTQDFPLFHLSPYDAVRTSINYEGRSTSWYRDFTTTNLIQLWRKRRPVQHVFSHISRFCSDTQQWKSGESTFRALKTKDSMDSATSLAEMKGIGKISVTVHRVHRIKRAIPRRSIVGHQKPITEVSEKVLKGKAIANTVQQVSVSVAKEKLSVEPPPTIYDIISMHGVHDHLQTLGCIPRTPSPEPQTTTNKSITNRDDKIKELRAQLALLEGDNVKDERSEARTRVKRELEDTQNERPRKRSRKLASIETIDLTED